MLQHNSLIQQYQQKEMGERPPLHPPRYAVGVSKKRLLHRQQRVTIAALAGHACRSCGTGPSGRAAAAPPTGSRVGLW